MFRIVGAAVRALGRPRLARREHFLRPPLARICLVCRAFPALSNALGRTCNRRLNGAFPFLADSAADPRCTCKEPPMQLQRVFGPLALAAAALGLWVLFAGPSSDPLGGTPRALSEAPVAYSAWAWGLLTG